MAQDATPSATPPAASEATPVSEENRAWSLYECDRIPDYVRAFSEAAPDMSPEELRVLQKWNNGEISYDTARPSEAKILSRVFDEWATGLELMADPDVPYAVQDFHDASIRRFSLLASGYNAVVNSDWLAVLAYTEQEEEVGLALDRGRLLADVHCDGLLSEEWNG